MNNKIVVSVYCLAYNHAKYIGKTLEGFVNQNTNFEYEVIVHDDASKDETQDIILEFAKKYPDIIKPILQKENQYSKGTSIIKNIIFPQLSGKYIAICEGDDYWCDNNKLQKQVDYLDNHHDCIACVHNTKKLIDNKLTNEVFNSKKSNGYLRIKDLLATGSNQFHTSSIMYRRELMIRDDRPYFMDCVKSIGDYPMSVNMAISGKVYYFKDVMSVYRVASDYSWTNRILENVDKFVTLKKQCIDMLKSANEYSNYKYNKEFKFAILVQEYEQLRMKNSKLNLFKFYPVIVYKLIRKFKFLFYNLVQ